MHALKLKLKRFAACRLLLVFKLAWHCIACFQRCFPVSRCLLPPIGHCQKKYWHGARPQCKHLSMRPVWLRASSW